MSLTNDQKAMLDTLLEGVDVPDIITRNWHQFSSRFLEAVSIGDVEYYFESLMVVYQQSLANEKRKAEGEANRLKAQHNSIDSYMANQLSYVKNLIPEARVELRSGPVLTKVTVTAGDMSLTLEFRRESMSLMADFYVNGKKAINYEDLSKWNGMVAGHEQSVLFVHFRNFVGEAAANKK